MQEARFKRVWLRLSDDLGLRPVQARMWHPYIVGVSIKLYEYPGWGFVEDIVNEFVSRT